MGLGSKMKKPHNPSLLKYKLLQIKTILASTVVSAMIAGLGIHFY